MPARLSSAERRKQQRKNSFLLFILSRFCKAQAEPPVCTSGSLFSFLCRHFCSFSSLLILCSPASLHAQLCPPCLPFHFDPSHTLPLSIQLFFLALFPFSLILFFCLACISNSSSQLTLSSDPFVLFDNHVLLSSFAPCILFFLEPPLARKGRAYLANPLRTCLYSRSLPRSNLKRSSSLEGAGCAWIRRSCKQGAWPGTSIMCASLCSSRCLSESLF